MTRRQEVQVRYYLPEEKRKELKKYAEENHTSIQEILENFTIELLRDYKRIDLLREKK